jgi:hypothetical protein
LRLFRHNFAENGPRDLKNGLERRVSQFYTICDQKSAPKQKYWDSYGNSVEGLRDFWLLIDTGKIENRETLFSAAVCTLICTLK